MEHAHFLGSYPSTRMRRQRYHAWWRELVAEHTLHVHDLIWPLFLREPTESPEIKSLWGVKRHTIEEAVEAVAKAYELGIQAVMLFPYNDPATLTERGEHSLNPENLLCRALRMIRAAHPHMGLIADVALDPYTSHGHDGIFDGQDVLNDPTVQVLCQQALNLAQAGVQMVAPSDMMDGRVGAIRTTLDQHGFETVGILSYGVKSASAFYGPFRDAVGSGGRLGKKDKKTYQLDYRHHQQPLQEIALDLQEGADAVIIKPALPYLDWICRAAHNFAAPLFCYHVSGEYMLLKTAAHHHMIDYDAALIETLTACKRAGARAIITYGAVEAAHLLKQG